MKLGLSAVALAVVGGLAVGGCTAGTTGHPLPGATPVDLSSLNIGQYSPEPTQYAVEDTVRPPDIRRIEANRMANYLTPVTDIDAELTDPIALEFFAEPKDPFDSKVMPDEYRTPIFDNLLVAGVYLVRTNGSTRAMRRLGLALLRFPTDAAARAAAGEMSRVARGEHGQSLAIDGLPTAAASTSNGSAGIAFLANGPIVVMANYGQPQQDPEAVSAVLKKSLDAQLLAMNDLVPTPFDDVLDQPLDPEGIMRRALPKSPRFDDTFMTDADFSAYRPTGHLHFERNQALMKRAYTDTGVDLIGRRAGIVYRTRDFPAALRLQNALTALGGQDQELAAPPGLVDARCIELDKTDLLRSYNTVCAVVRGRYVGVVFGRKGPTGSLTILHEHAAAQYAVLAKSE